ncbi:MAG: lactonase family protein [Halobacteriales archaeon]
MTDTTSPTALVCGFADDDSGGVFAYRQDPDDGSLERLRTTPLAAVSFLAVGPDRERAYTVTRVEGGVVTSFDLDATEGALSRLNRRSSEGAGPAYVSVDATGSYAFVANYAGGTVAALPIDDDGHLGPASDVVRHEGSGPNADRQEEPHPHSIDPGPENRYVYAPDLGTDRVVTYRIDFEEGRLRGDGVPDVEVQPGAGPRHLDFHPNGRYCYLINELDSTVVAFEQDPETGALEAFQTVGTLPDEFDGLNQCADVHVHPSGEWLYGSNRGHDSIAIYGIDAETGRLDPVGHESTRGHWPRHFAIDPAGRYLYAENRRSDSVVTFAIDPDTGKLTPTGDRLELPEPLCLLVVD